MIRARSEGDRQISICQFNLPDRIYPQVSVVGLLLGPLVVLISSLLATLYPVIKLYWL